MMSDTKQTVPKNQDLFPQLSYSFFAESRWPKRRRFLHNGIIDAAIYPTSPSVCITVHKCTILRAVPISAAAHT